MAASSWIGTPSTSWKRKSTALSAWFWVDADTAVGERRDEAADVIRTEAARVAVSVKRREPARPSDVGLLGPAAVVADTERLAELSQNARRTRSHVRSYENIVPVHGPSVWTD
jgi:hypothetical protein